jgi:hypothetical protein
VNGTTYFVFEDGGAQQGPADLDLLRSWLAEGRITANTQLENQETGEIVLASSIPGLLTPIEPTSESAPTESSPELASIDNYLVPAILTTLFCCQLLGIVSMVYAVMAVSFARAGNPESAKSNAESAKQWLSTAIICGLFFYIFLIAIYQTGHLGFLH